MRVSDEEYKNLKDIRDKCKYRSLVCDLDTEPCMYVICTGRCLVLRYALAKIMPTIWG